MITGYPHSSPASGVRIADFFTNFAENSHASMTETTQLRFNCDYMEGCHPAIMQRLQDINLEKNVGYGLDPISQSAQERIREACGCPEANVQFLVGGTQTNMVIIDAMLRANEGILCAQSGHINVHEAGAIEGSGHKVIGVPATDGKINIDALEQWLADFEQEATRVGHEHYVVPRAVYVSLPTELGTLYSLAELERLRAICDRYGLLLYLDGARLAYGLASPEADVTLPDVARITDAFYIGGTKTGALIGEAAVVTNPAIRLTRGLIKHRGAMLAKGWLLGLQFDTLMADGLWLEIGRNAVEQALALRAALQLKGYEPYILSPTNQQFFIVPSSKLAELDAAGVGYDYICPLDAGRSVMRLCTSWATTDAQVAALLAVM